MNRHKHNLEIINSKTYLYKEKIDQRSRIKYIKNYNHKVNILNSILNEKWKTTIYPTALHTLFFGAFTDKYAESISCGI